MALLQELNDTIWKKLFAMHIPTENSYRFVHIRWPRQRKNRQKIGSAIYLKEYQISKTTHGKGLNLI